MGVVGSDFPLDLLQNELDRLIHHGCRGTDITVPLYNTRIRRIRLKHCSLPRVAVR